MARQPRRVYLDVSALCRPFDDQSHIRVRLETEAVQLILSHVRAETLELIVSAVHDVEIAAIDDTAERIHLQVMLEQIGLRLAVDTSQTRQRAETLVQQGLGPADAAHLAWAEQTGCDFVTCDDRLLRQCRRIKPGIWFGTPITFCDKEDLR
ncbi:MAG: PIN domain-containing protein [Anaerolineae bacterium]|nr:PIN domain-containing protein [Anaerolineae bacterium]